jgi:hypothetical protein
VCSHHAALRGGFFFNDFILNQPKQLQPNKPKKVINLLRQKLRDSRILDKLKTTLITDL